MNCGHWLLTGPRGRQSDCVVTTCDDQRVACGTADGTLFLDELGALPSAVQPMLLMVLETGEFSLMGSTQVLEADIRVIAATNRDLSAAIAEGVFREDLVGRLSPRYHVPPLRERRGEIEGIIQRFLREKHGATGVRFQVAEDAMYRLRNHDWWGNIRELINVLRCCVMLSKDRVVPLDVVDKGIQFRTRGSGRSRGGNGGQPSLGSGRRTRRSGEC